MRCSTNRFTTISRFIFYNAVPGKPVREETKIRTRTATTTTTTTITITIPKIAKTTPNIGGFLLGLSVDSSRNPSLFDLDHQAQSMRSGAYHWKPRPLRMPKFSKITRQIWLGTRTCMGPKSDSRRSRCGEGL